MTTILPELERELARRAEAEQTRGREAPARAPRRRMQLALLTTVTVAVATFVVLALPIGDRTRLDVVKEARAALDPGRSIIHTVTTRRTGPTPAGYRTVLADGTSVQGDYFEARTQHWGSSDPLRYRDITVDRLGRTVLGSKEEAYDEQRFTRVDGDVVKTRRVGRAMSELLLNSSRMGGAFSANGPFTDDPVADLRTLLSDGTIRPAGERTFANRRVLRLVPADPAADRRAAQTSRSQVGLLFAAEYLVDAATYAPVRVTYRYPETTVGDPPRRYITTTITFEEYERLDPTPANERLLAIDPAGRPVINDPTMFQGSKVRMKRPPAKTRR